MKKKWLNVPLNILLFIALCYTTYSWMITDPSKAEVVDYTKTLIIPTADVEVDFYVMIDDNYVLQTDPIIDFGMMEPGSIQRYRFDIKNNTAGTAAIKIVFSNITGDLPELSNYLIFGGTNPLQYRFTLGEKLTTNIQNGQKYLTFYENLNIPDSATVSLFWYATVDKNATNELMNKNAYIAEIIFMQS